MNYFIAILFFVSFLGDLKAEDREAIMSLLAEKLELEGPDNIIIGEESINYRNEFMRKHQKLFDSLGKKEIFYHIDLAFRSYNENRPGPQPHAVYAVHLHSKFHKDYTEEENKLILEKFTNFSEKGWIRKKDFESFQSVRSEKTSTRPTPSKEATKDQDPNGSLGEKGTQDKQKKLDLQKGEKQTNRLPWIFSGLLLLGILTLLFKTLKGKPTP